MAQNITVTGKVTDQMGNTLPSVSVIVYGTTHGTITDIEGNYTLEAPADATLQYNFLGFAIQRIPINNRQVIDVVLQEDLLRLDNHPVPGRKNYPFLFGVDFQPKPAYFEVINF